MLELKVQDLRLRGCGFTLFPAAKENGVEAELMIFLVNALYIKSGFFSEESIRDNPNIPDTISKEELKESVWAKDYSVQDLLNNGLVVTADGSNLVLTEKSITILKRAAEIQNELDAQGFHHCPCHC